MLAVADSAKTEVETGINPEAGLRREISRLSLDVELRDAKGDPQHREALLQGGGAIKVPCLRITDEQGNSQWMYESADIIQYLHERFT